MDKRLEQYSPQKDILIANKQNAQQHWSSGKCTIKPQWDTTKMAKIKETGNINVDSDVEQLELLSNDGASKKGTTLRKVK